eukprot:TRINITY_DN10565_c0_g1_i1.p1 TRINITY_DN10565_c0_g1~~TRINITY_DN10565_c0_g1_i1.p1  ORF type:complete len:217 (-),score=8.81 TRINITY_DN10565_c0_g1_i1:120-770(-)
METAQTFIQQLPSPSTNRLKCSSVVINHLTQKMHMFFTWRCSSSGRPAWCCQRSSSHARRGLWRPALSAAWLLACEEQHHRIVQPQQLVVITTRRSSSSNASSPPAPRSPQAGHAGRPDASGGPPTADCEAGDVPPATSTRPCCVCRLIHRLLNAVHVASFRYSAAWLLDHASPGSPEHKTMLLQYIRAELGMLPGDSLKDCLLVSSSVALQLTGN